MPKLSPRARRNLARILPFPIIYFLFSQVFLITDYAAVGDLSDVPDTAIQLTLPIYVFASLAVTVVALLIGTVEVLYMTNRFTKRTLTQKVVYKTLFYSLLLLGVTVLVFPVAASLELGTSLWDARVRDKLGSFLVSKTHLSTFVQMSTMLGVALFYSEISEHIGHRVMLDLLKGKYHTPKEETRIFMFSDMKSSTQIAEQLGHIEYFELLRAYYTDLSGGIIAHAGEIYQYVGDEVVVSWPAEKGLKHQHCVRCFFAMKQDLRRRADWYRQRFGVVPDFKAGFQMGAVTTGEIGALKKEIIFTGDVLNATARIQGLCNQYDVDLLIAGDLLRRLDPGGAFEVTPLGQRKLRGKAQEVELFTLTPRDGAVPTRATPPAPPATPPAPSR